jgi:phage antirepressor YoqD-like protein
MLLYHQLGKTTPCLAIVHSLIAHMTSSIVSDFACFNADGLELVVNTSTGLAYASVSAAARMLEISKSTVSAAFDNHETTEAQLLTVSGSKTVRLASADVVFDLAFKHHPGLAKRMGTAGANLYMLKLAGYEAKVVEIQPIQIPQTYAAALMEAGRLAMEVDRLEAEKLQSAPLVDYALAVQQSDDTIDFNAYAKMIGSGRTRLFKALREADVIMKNSTLPYQKFVEAGYFEVSQEIIEDGKLIPFALITGKGQLWLKQRLTDRANFQRQFINAVADSVQQMSLFDKRDAA